LKLMRNVNFLFPYAWCRRATLVCLVICCMAQVQAQRPYWEMMTDSTVDLQAAKRAFEEYWTGKTPEKGQGYKVFKRWAYMNELRQDAQGHVPATGQEAQEYLRWKREEETQRRTNLTPTGNWSPMGPVALPANLTGQPGGIARLTTMSFHPTDPNILYAGTPNGGLWVSNNAGASWATNTDLLPTLGVSAILSDPITPTTMYIGTGDKDGGSSNGLGVYKSINGGLNWVVSNTGMGNRTVHSMVLDPNNNSTLIAATTNGVYRSINAGANWALVLNGGGTYFQVGYRPGSSTTLYAVNQDRFFTSVDDGATWNAGVVVAAASRTAFATTPANPNYVYLVKDLGNNPVYRSIDGGVTFVNVQTDGKVLLNGDCSGGGSGGQGWYDICIAVDPTDADKVTVGGVSLWKSSDGGVNFKIAACWGSMGTNVHADHHCLSYSPHNAARLYDGNDGGLYYTDNFGVSYTNISSGIAASLIYRVGLSAQDPNVLVAGFQDNGMIISRQPNWYITVGGDGTECAIDPTDDNYQYGSYVNGVIRRSVNGGYNWSTIGNNGVGGINEDGPWVTPYALQPGNPNVMIAGYVSLWRSANVKAGAPAFANVQAFATGSIRDIAFADANTVYAGRDNDEFWQSLDGGITWIQKANTPGGAVRDIATDPATPQRVWVTAGNNVYQSLDGGSTWAVYDVGLPNINAYAVVYDKVANALYCGMSIGVYYRHITDPSWAAYSTGLPNTQSTHLQIFYDQNGCVGRDKLILATYGRGIWQSDLRSSPTQAPVACFGADTTIVCAVNGVLQLRDSSAYDPTSWAWVITGPGVASFVGGTNASDQNPQVTFPVTGLYTITLTATNINGPDVKTRVDYILVVTPPVAFSSSDTLIYLGQSAQFTDQSSDCANTWLWDFGDGFTSTLQNPSHVYATAGLYTVSLTINNGVNSLTKTGFIQVLPHLSVPYTSITTGWTGDMESDATAWHFGDKRLSGLVNNFERGSVALTFPAAASGTKCWATDLDADVPVASYVNTVMTPTFNFSSAGKYQVRMKTAMQSVYCNAPLGAVVEYTTNEGGTWTRLGGKQGTDPDAFANWYNRGGTGGCDNADQIPGNIGWNYTGLTFRQAIYDASTLAGNARVGFRIDFFSSSAYGAFTSKGFAFDDFEIDFVPVPGVPDTIPGRMIAFDGVDDYVETYYDANLANFTAEAWVMSPLAPSGAARSSILQKGSVLEFNWNHPSGASRGAVVMRNSAGTWQSYTFGPLAANTWYHLAVTFDGTTVRTYKNGLLVTSAAFTGPLTINTNTWQLGIGSGFLNGSVDEFRMWNVARTQQEVREAMHRTLDPSELTNVVTYYQSNETSGYFKDVTNLRNGYLQNGLGRALSPIGVGKGVSQSLSVTATGSYDFLTPKLRLDFTAAAGTPFDITVTRINQFINQQTPNPAWNAAPNATLVDNNPYFYHVINKFGGGAFTTNVVVSGIPGISSLEAATPGFLKWVKRGSNSVGIWDVGIPAVAATMSTGFNGTATFNGITTFSQAFIGSESSDVLPLDDVHLMAMGVPETQSVNLAWDISQQPQDVTWTLARADAPDGFNNAAFSNLWTAIAGDFGDQFVDTQVAEGMPYYYQLHGIDGNGFLHASNIVEARLDGQQRGLRVIPNPNTGNFFADFVGNGGLADLVMTDLDGRIVWTSAASTEIGLSRVAIDLQGLPAGLYFLQVKTGSHSMTEKVVVTR
jgi:PKD repeat protein